MALHAGVTAALLLFPWNDQGSAHRGSAVNQEHLAGDQGGPNALASTSDNPHLVFQHAHHDFPVKLDALDQFATYLDIRRIVRGGKAPSVKGCQSLYSALCDYNKMIQRHARVQAEAAGAMRSVRLRSGGSDEGK